MIAVDFAKKQLLAVVMISVLLLVLMLGYLICVARSNRQYDNWPLYRTFCWFGGCISAAFVIFSLFLNQPNFVEHMLHHLLLGMLSPLLLVLSTPLTLLLRSLSVTHARRITKILKSRLLVFYHHPLIASLMNIGGLWFLYLTDLHHLLHRHWLIALFIHIHLFLAGYLFTTSMIELEPTSHRYSFRLRAIVLIVAMAGHALLAKWIYAYPPSGVSPAEAKLAGMKMYYGGDVIDVVIIYFLCFKQYRATRPKRLRDTMVYES